MCNLIKTLFDNDIVNSNIIMEKLPLNRLMILSNSPVSIEHLIINLL